jgi:hypothetical protein
MSAHPVLLDDASMRDFVVDGYVVVKADFPNDVHESIFRQTEAVFENEGNPGNNILPRVPQLQSVLDHPRVHGALSSILGPEYYVHPCRHCHFNSPGSPGQQMHRDSFTRRRHRTRWAMAFYYPQDVPEEKGPTAVSPGSHYHNTYSEDAAAPEVALGGEAGTVAIVHYDLWHRGTPNRTDQKRFMHKFLFTRMQEPKSPSWNSTAEAWPQTADPRQAMWQNLWDWHSGRGENGATTAAANGSVAALIRGLQDESEAQCLQAAYALSALGAPAVPALVEVLQDESGELRRNAAYALSALGAPAVPALIEAAADEREWTRDSAVDVLADIGRPAQPAVPALIEALGDAAAPVRGRAAEALGILGSCASESVAALTGALRDPDQDVRRHAALALARMGAAAEPAVPALVEAQNDDDRYVRSKALKALERIDTPTARKALLDALLLARWCPITTKESTF